MRYPLNLWWHWQCHNHRIPPLCHLLSHHAEDGHSRMVRNLIGGLSPRVGQHLWSINVLPNGTWNFCDEFPGLFPNIRTHSVIFERISASFWLRHEHCKIVCYLPRVCFNDINFFVELLLAPDVISSLISLIHHLQLILLLTFNIILAPLSVSIHGQFFWSMDFQARVSPSFIMQSFYQ